MFHVTFLRLALSDVPVHVLNSSLFGSRVDQPTLVILPDLTTISASP
jgi:hypothetical protein